MWSDSILVPPALRQLDQSIGPDTRMGDATLVKFRQQIAYLRLRPLAGFAQQRDPLCRVMLR
jgi:hypothetical protein